MAFLQVQQFLQECYNGGCKARLNSCKTKISVRTGSAKIRQPTELERYSIPQKVHILVVLILKNWEVLY